MRDAHSEVPRPESGQAGDDVLGLVRRGGIRDGGQQHLNSERGDQSDCEAGGRA